MSVESSRTMKIWECKECNNSVADNDSVAFHLVNGFLYGWCRACFEKAATLRNQLNANEKAKSAA